MSFNLLESTKAFFPEQFISAISSASEEPADRIAKAVDAAIPAVLCGVLNLAGSHEGAEEVLTLSKTVNNSTEALKLDDFLHEETRYTADRRGTNLLNSIFGYRNLEVEGALAGYADIKDSSASTLLKMAATAALGVIGKHAEYNNLSLAAFVGELSLEKDIIIAKVPAELPLAKMLGLGHLSLISEKFQVEKDIEAKEIPVRPPVPGSAEKKSIIIPWLWIVAVIALAVFIYLLICHSKRANVPDVLIEKKLSKEVTQYIHARSGRLDTITQNFIYEVGSIGKIKLPDGTMIEAGENSTEALLIKMITDSSFIVNETDKTQGWIPLDRVYFESGSARLTEDSRKQLLNIASILEVYKNVHVKIGGYTDNTGTDEVNMPLSDERAKAAMADLFKEGVAEVQLKSEGYGSAHAVCPANDTPECKAKNRRVDIRLVHK